MLVIRLSRTGRRNQPKYRLVVAEHTAPIKGKVVEILGHYEPIASDKKFVFNKEKLDMYMKNGAKPSNTVAKLLNKHGYDLPIHVRPERKPRKEAEEKTTSKPAPDDSKNSQTGEDSDGQEPVEGGAKEGEAEKSVETPTESETIEASATADKPAEVEKASDDNQDSQTGKEEKPTEETQE